MKLIIIEGSDRCGKSTLIEGLCKHLNYDNVAIRHFGKPPSDLTPEKSDHFQFKAFKQEADAFHDMRNRFQYSQYKYYDETVIWNRSHLGEYVYSQMFRGGDAKTLKEKILFFEKLNFQNDPDIYLITFLADPEFVMKLEDGQSFSKTYEQKSKEMELFKEAHLLSIIHNKFMFNVDVNGKWRPKSEILDDVLKFINEK